MLRAESCQQWDGAGRHATRNASCNIAQGTLNPDMKTLEELKNTYNVPVFKTFDAGSVH